MRLENIALSSNIMVPLLLLMVVGYILKHVKILDDHVIEKLNRASFYLFLPVLIFVSIYKADLTRLTSYRFVIFGVLSVILIFILTIIVVPRLIRENSKRSVVIQVLYRSNFVLLGISICNSLYGAENTSATTLLISLIVLLNNCIAVVVLNIYGPNKKSIGNLLFAIIKNPLIIAAILGWIMKLMNLRMPIIIEATLADIANTAVPISLILLGGYFKFNFRQSDKKILFWGVFFRLIAIPMIFIPLSIFLAFKGVELATLMVMFTAPAAFSIFSMSQEMGGDSRLASQMVVFSTSISVLTIYIWLTILIQMDLL